MSARYGLGPIQLSMPKKGQKPKINDDLLYCPKQGFLSFKTECRSGSFKHRFRSYGHLRNCGPLPIPYYSTPAGAGVGFGPVITLKPCNPPIFLYFIPDYDNIQVGGQVWVTAARCRPGGDGTGKTKKPQAALYNINGQNNRLEDLTVNVAVRYASISPVQ